MGLLRGLLFLFSVILGTTLTVQGGFSVSVDSPVVVEYGAGCKDGCVDSCPLSWEEADDKCFYWGQKGTLQRLTAGTRELTWSPS